MLALLAVAALIAGPEGRALDRVAARYAEYGFGGVVLVTRGDRVILHRAYGLADRKQNIANSITTRFPIASITKSFTAAAIQQLADGGKLALDDPISKFLGPLPYEITVRQLLNHTSGLPQEEADVKVDPSTRELLVAGLRTLHLESPPGAKESYSNFGYNVLATIVEIVSGEKFSDYVAKHLAAPAGLTSTNFDLTNTAVGYAGAEDDPQPTTPPTYAGKYGSGALASTAADLYRWGKWSPKTFAWDPDKSEDGRRVLDSGGDWDGYKSTLRVYPDDRVMIVILANVRPNTMRWNTTLYRNFERVLFGNRAPFIPPHVGQASACPCGDYATAAGDRFHITQKGALISVQAFGQSAIDALAYPRGVRPAELRTLDDDTRALLDTLQAADSVRIAAVAESPSGVGTFTGWWAQRITPDHGALKQATLLGTAPKGPSRWETYVRLDLERGSEMIRVVRRRGTLKLVAIGVGGDAPFAAAFRPVGTGTFASFDVPAEEVVTLEVRGDELIARRGETAVVAHRVLRSPA